MCWRNLRRGLVIVLFSMLNVENGEYSQVKRRRRRVLENTRREDRSVLWKRCHELAVPWCDVCVRSALTVGEEGEGTVGLLRLW